MPIVTLQRRFRELGRLRMGKQDGNRPVKLKTWRVTSASERLLQAVATRYGGEVRPWDQPGVEGQMFEVITEADALRIIVPPVQTLNQWFELWKGGGCKRRCDGERQVGRDVPCSCPEEPAERMAAAQRGEACSPTTRLSVILEGVPDLGVWRLESHGYNAATELAGAFETLRLATNNGRYIPAWLRIDARKVKREGERHPRRFVVPVLEIEGTIADVAHELGELGLPIPQVEGRSHQSGPALPPGPDVVGGDWITPAEPPPALPEEEPDLVPTWVAELPGSDGSIVLEANRLLEAAGEEPRIAALGDLEDAPPEFQQSLRERLEAVEVKA